VFQKKEATKLLAITFSNRNRFLKFFHCGFVGNFILFSAVKEFWNRLRFGKVIAKSLVASFFATQCIFVYVAAAETAGWLVREGHVFVVIIQTCLWLTEQQVIKVWLTKRACLLIKIVPLIVHCESKKTVPLLFLL